MNLDSLYTGFPSDYFSVNWEGFIQAKGETEWYRLYIDSLDYTSIELLIDDKLIINTLESHQCFGDVVLEKDKLHKI